MHVTETLSGHVKDNHIQNWPILIYNVDEIGLPLNPRAELFSSKNIKALQSITRSEKSNYAVRNVLAP